MRRGGRGPRWFGRPAAFAKMNHVGERDFDANRFFSSVMGESVLEDDSLGRLCYQHAAHGKMKIARAIVRFHPFTREGEIVPHAP